MDRYILTRQVISILKPVLVLNVCLKSDFIGIDFGFSSLIFLNKSSIFGIALF